MFSRSLLSDPALRCWVSLSWPPTLRSCSPMRGVRQAGFSRPTEADIKRALARAHATVGEEGPASRYARRQRARGTLRDPDLRPALLADREVWGTHATVEETSVGVPSRFKGRWGCRVVVGEVSEVSEARGLVWSRGPVSQSVSESVSQRVSESAKALP